MNKISSSLIVEIFGISQIIDPHQKGISNDDTSAPNWVSRRVNSQGGSTRFIICLPRVEFGFNSFQFQFIIYCGQKCLQLKYRAFTFSGFQWSCYYPHFLFTKKKSTKIYMFFLKKKYFQLFFLLSFLVFYNIHYSQSLNDILIMIMVCCVITHNVFCVTNTYFF